MMYVQAGLYVRIEEDQTPAAPLPKPMQHGFSKQFVYLVLGAFSLAESGEAYFILANDRDEIWFISNRHLRVQELRPESREFRLTVPQVATVKKNGAHPPAPRPATRSVVRRRNR